MHMHMRRCNCMQLRNMQCDQAMHVCVHVCLAPDQQFCCIQRKQGTYKRGTGNEEMGEIEKQDSMTLQSWVPRVADCS